LAGRYLTAWAADFPKKFEDFMEQADSAKTFLQIEEAIAKLRLQSASVAGSSQETEHELIYRHLLGAASRFELSTQTLSHLESRSNDLIKQIKQSPNTSSRLPGGSLIHRIMCRLTSRQITHNQQIAEAQVQLFNTLVSETKRLFEAQRSADERQLADLLAAVVDRLAVVDALDAERSLAKNPSSRPAE
jgi:hypothetical protein